MQADMATSPWLRVKRLPRYDGLFECKTAQGMVIRVEWRNNAWGELPADVTHWRGRLTLLPENEVQRLREVLGDFRNKRSQPHARRDAGEAALRLARYCAGPTKNHDRGNRAKACELFLIAHKLEAALDNADFDYQRSRWTKLRANTREKISRKVEAFLGVIPASQ